MKVQTEFEVTQFISYLNKYEKLDITNRKYSNGFWNITLNNDNISYEIPDLLWNLIQDQVPRLNINKQVIQ